MAKVIEVTQPASKTFVLELDETELVAVVRALGRTSGAQLLQEIKSIHPYRKFDIDHEHLEKGNFDFYDMLYELAEKEVRKK